MDSKEKNDNTGLKFDEEQKQQFSYIQKTSKITLWIIKYSGGLVKNKKQAQYVTTGFVVVATLTSLFILSGMGVREAEINVNPITGVEIIPGQILDGI